MRLNYHRWRLICSSSPARRHDSVILDSGENGGREQEGKAMEAFNRIVSDCDLEDLGGLGYPYTWSNTRFGNALIEERLC